MGSKRKKKEYLMLGWLSAKKDNLESNYVSIGNSLFFSEAYKSLPDGAQNLYLRLASDAQGKPAVKFSRTDGVKYGISPASCHRWLKTLEEKGFISCIERYNGGSIKSTYRFEFGWKDR